MDTSDPEIVFDKQGVCNHCHSYDRYMLEQFPPEGHREQLLNSLVDSIKHSGKGKRYDCIIGVSGGVDSTYVAYMVKRLGLRPLAVHLDNGWDSELAVSNIEKVLKKLDIDLYTHVIDWEEFKDLQLAFLTASTPDSEIPTDHAIVAVLFEIAKKHGIKFILSGLNYRTESVLPRTWSHGHYDWRYIHGIHKRFGTVALKTFPHYSYCKFLQYILLHRIRVEYILNYLPEFKKEEVTAFLENDLGWRNYGGKHYESIYTRFFQSYILPKKFGFDKRRAHLASLVLSGQLTREKALTQMQEVAYSENQATEDREFVIKKLGLTEAAFNEILRLPKKSFYNYQSYETSLVYRLVFALARSVRGIVGKAFRIKTV